MKFLLAVCLTVFWFASARACSGLSGVPSIPAGSIPSGGGITGGKSLPKKKCLHQDAKVLMADGSVKKAGDLLIGDRVWSENGKSSAVILTPDTDVDEVAPFVTFQTQSGLKTTLTPHHAVFARQCGASNVGSWPIKPSADLSIGDCVPTVQGGEDKVVAMSLVDLPGRVQPITQDGKIPVDGIVVSCYDYSTDNVTQEDRHAPLEPMRQLYSFAEKIYFSLSNEQYALGVLDSLIKGMGLEKLYYQ